MGDVIQGSFPYQPNLEGSNNQAIDTNLGNNEANTVFSSQFNAEVLRHFLLFSETEKSASIQGEDMSEQTREEVDAKLATLNARAETRSVELSAKIDRLSDLIGTSIASLTKEVSGVSGQIKQELVDIRDEMRTVKQDNRYTRFTIITVVIAAIIAGLAALWTTQSDLLAAFQTGLSVKSEQHSPESKPK